MHKHKLGAPGEVGGGGADEYMSHRCVRLTLIMSTEYVVTLHRNTAQYTYKHTIVNNKTL